MHHAHRENYEAKMREHFKIKEIDFYKQKINKSRTSLLSIIVIAEYIFGSISFDTHK